MKEGKSVDINVKDLGFEVAHVGINRPDARQAHNTADVLSDLFGFPQRETPGSIFVNNQFEIMKTKFLGECGHIAIRTNDAAKAREYLASKGVEFDEETANYDENGKLATIYMKNDIAGFAVHLLQKK
ncbi:VOC family protein [Caproiciproducens sp.]|uniref:VOC family protein n=1 Tax=Caproiciproducens sp. TaxID=1954376 RepID=UPI00289BEC19|nr:VOC family protein [Caproiciproducens sp.]